MEKRQKWEFALHVSPMAGAVATERNLLHHFYDRGSEATDANTNPR